MSDKVEGLDAKVIEKLEQEKRVAEELLFLVLEYIAEPVVLDIEAAKERMTSNRRIDLDLNAEDKTMTLSVVPTDG